MRFVVRVLVAALALGAAALLVDGVDVTSAAGPDAGRVTGDAALTMLLVALLFGVVNAVVRPVVKLLSLPAYVLTLGLFFLVVNALMLWLTGALSDLLGLPFVVDGFGAAFLGGIVVSVVSWLADVVLPDRYERR